MLTAILFGVPIAVGLWVRTRSNRPWIGLIAGVATFLALVALGSLAVHQTFT